MAPSKFDLGELRYWIYGSVLLVLFLIWLSKLFVLQVIMGDNFASEAQQITERRELLSAKRGLIYYNDGLTPIVNNIDIFTVYLTPALASQEELAAETALLAQILGISSSAIEAGLRGQRNPLQPITLKTNVSLAQIKQIAERKDRLPGVSYTSKPQRNLLENNSIIHVVGYVGNISDDELEVLYGDQYQPNTSIGKTGIEQYYDTLLRGYDGRRIRVVDAAGNILDERIQTPQTGASLTLTIDRRIQELAEKALGHHVGSAVVLRPATGEVLALVSTPWYSLDAFANTARYQKLLEDPRKPLLNRTIQSRYPPASTFKLVTATAMLATRSFSPTEYIFDSGSWQLGNRTFRCWLRTGHGNENLEDAIADSCNIYFGIVGVRHVGEANILEYARKYGLGELTEIDLPGEVRGFVPSVDWKYRTYHEAWTQGDTLNISIGQGYMLTTPLQVAMYTAAIVNNGIAYKPYLLKEVHNENGSGEDSTTEPEVLFNMHLDANIFRQIKTGMRRAVVGGTARGTVYNGVVDIAAKTGTAELGISNNWHSWFASFGPYDVSDPMDRIVVITQVEADPTAPAATYDWWAPRAADIIYRGIFANETYEEVWLNYRQRRVWFHSLMDVPPEYQDSQISISSENIASGT